MLGGGGWVVTVVWLDDAKLDNFEFFWDPLWYVMVIIGK